MSDPRGHRVAAVNWLIDFDETLATGSLTWALEEAFPKLIRAHRLLGDVAQLSQAVYTAQEQSSQGRDPREILTGLFATMAWPPGLARELMTDIMTNYRPRLYVDVLPLLMRLRGAGRRVFVLSNNPISPQSVRQLELEPWIEAVVTPDREAGLRPKPHRDLWDRMISLDQSITAENTVYVGDDPWVDGRFAEVCGIPCWIIDRPGRLKHLRAGSPYRWVRSLDEIDLN